LFHCDRSPSKDPGFSGVEHTKAELLFYSAAIGIKQRSDFSKQMGFHEHRTVSTWVPWFFNMCARLGTYI
jgi:hypothetical protein